MPSFFNNYITKQEKKQARDEFFELTALTCPLFQPTELLLLSKPFRIFQVYSWKKSFRLAPAKPTKPVPSNRIATEFEVGDLPADTSSMIVSKLWGKLVIAFAGAKDKNTIIISKTNFDTFFIVFSL